MLSVKEKIRARVVLADDHPEIVENLRALVEPEFEVVATVGDGHALVGAAETLAPDVIVTDIAMPGLNGIAAAARIIASNPAARIVFVTAHNHPVLVQKGMATGALGYVLKLTAGAMIFFPRSVLRRLARSRSRPSTPQSGNKL